MRRHKRVVCTTSSSSDDSDLDEDYYASYEDKRKARREKAKRSKAKMEAKAAKLQAKRIKRIRIPTFKPARLADDRGFPFVKNFCVGLQLLDDELVRSALLGEIKWHVVFKKDDHQTERARKRIACQTSWDPGYLFERQGEPETAKAKSASVEPVDRTANLSFLAASQQQRDSSTDFSSLRAFGEETSSLDSRLNSSLASTAFVSLDSRSSIAYDLGKNVSLKNLNRILAMLKIFDQSNGHEEIDLESSAEPLKCLDCSYTTTSILHLLQHSSFHRNRCSICQASQFKSVYAYYRHVGMHLKNSQTACSLKLDYRCTHCSVRVRQERLLLEHFNHKHAVFELAQLHGEKTCRFKCLICGQVEVSYRSLKEHFVRSHAQLKCALCTRWLPNLDQLEQHALLDHRPSAHNFECCFCHQLFTFRAAFEEHFKYRHGIVIDAEKRGSCFLCSVQFDQDRERVLAHLAGHCDLQLYNCETCDFRTNSELEMAKHTMKVGLTDSCVLLGSGRLDIADLWRELARRIQVSLQDYVVRDPLADAIASIVSS